MFFSVSQNQRFGLPYRLHEDFDLFIAYYAAFFHILIDVLKKVNSIMNLLEIAKLQAIDY
jgi:hypothetical protein